MPDFEEVLVPIQETATGIRVDVGIHARLPHPGECLRGGVGQGGSIVILWQLREVCTSTKVLQEPDPLPPSLQHHNTYLT